MKAAHARYAAAQAAAYAATERADADPTRALHMEAARLHTSAAEAAANLSASNFKHHQGLARDHASAAVYAAKADGTGEE